MTMQLYLDTPKTALIYWANSTHWYYREHNESIESTESSAELSGKIIYWSSDTSWCREADWQLCWGYRCWTRTNTHIDHVCQKAKRQAGLIYIQFYQASRACKSQLYKLFMLPTLDYCSLLWDPTYAINTKVDAVQKVCAKIITKKWDHTYDHLLHEVNWTPLFTRTTRKYLCAFVLLRVLHYSLFLFYTPPVTPATA